LIEKKAGLAHGTGQGVASFTSRPTGYTSIAGLVVALSAGFLAFSACKYESRVTGANSPYEGSACYTPHTGPCVKGSALVA